MELNDKFIKGIILSLEQLVWLFHFWLWEGNYQVF